MKLRAGTAEVNGTRLYYEMRGVGPALLFLHGFTLDHRMWRPQAEALSNRFCVITYDARGFGRSEVPGLEPYRHCDDAAALCEVLGVGPVVAIGHSIGGHQTLELTLSCPDRVVGWVAVCLSGLAGIAFPPDITEMFASLRRTAREESVDAAKTIWSRCGWFATARTSHSLATQLDAMLADYSGWHWTHENPAMGIDPPAASRLGELRVPALVITGGLDLAYNATVGDALANGISSARALRLSNAGHMANMEQPATVSDAIADLAHQAFGA